ncbi:glycosyltransferase family 4 protein [Hippea jasoniae]|uniref:glycosyltransferase family 4 protein n=1 Tax=Hippea jasoniae TaxID=944479 RepID=UPI0005513C3A|nr:glycosyltransferase [Hippea jasoniae]
MVKSAIFGFVISLVICLLLIKFSKWGGFGVDEIKSGPQKFHDKPTPRVGGVGIFMGFAVAVVELYWVANNKELLLFLLAGVPTFLGGLVEDLTHKVSPKVRLFLALFAGFFVVWLLKASVGYIAFPVLGRLDFPLWFSWIFTIFAIAGVTNSINIIDGYNGLASMVSIMILLGLFYVSYKLNDKLLMQLSLILIFSIAGFFIWNFPFGSIFMGDGGAYFVGFSIATISVLLVDRHRSVSVWFPFLLVIYPVFETLFSIYRKKFLRGISPDQPDGLHLHMLIYKRVVKFLFNESSQQYKVFRNSSTSPFLWFLTGLSVIPAILFWNNTNMLFLFCLIFIAIYLYLYFSIATFKTGRFLRFLKGQ